ncbi:Dystrophin [Gryllus bimaculatus]|nr:Dystrophin [Gryllus bimaculatus]
MRVHHLNNVNKALQILEQNNVKLVNISNNDIVDGNPKLTLGLVWSIILHWQVHYHLKHLMSDLQQTNLEKALLAWCRRNTKEYAGVDVRNFTTSWSDGLAFNALLHHWRPQLFDFNNIARKHPNARLEHAFRLAQEQLGIERLLDPEDVNTSVPDKKSIMMYVMCLFQSLPHTDLEVSSVDLSLGSETSSLLSPVAEGIGTVPGSRPLSLATNVSVELGSYQAALEEVLTWLLEAEDKLNNTPPVEGNLEAIKEQFYQHEDFLRELAGHQEGVRAVLEEGAHMVSEGGLSQDEEGEVRVQMRLLNSRWEDLRIKATNKQSQIHALLSERQQTQLDGLRRWLTATEDRMSHLAEEEQAGLGGLEGLKRRIEQHRELQQDLQRQQSVVDALKHMIVVVDDSCPENAYSQLEDQLTALGERWAHICQWAKERWSRLQNGHSAWMSLADDLARLQAWLDDRETALKQMEAQPAAEIGEVLGRIGKLQVLRREMEAQQKRITHLQEKASSLDGGGTELLEKLEILQDRWDALDQIMDVQGQRINNSGFDMSWTPLGDDPVSGDQILDGHWERTTTITTVTTNVVSNNQEMVQHSGSKKRRVGSASRQEFQSALQQHQVWLQHAEDTLHKGFTDLTVDEQQILLEEVTAEMQSRKPEKQRVQTLGQQLLDELMAEGESVSEERDLLTEVETKWSALQTLLEDQQRKVSFLKEKHQLAERQTELSNQLERTPPRKYLEAMEALTQWVHGVEGLLLSEHAVVAAIPAMQDQLHKFQVLEGVDEFKSWLCQLETEIPAASSVTSSTELFQLKGKYQVLKDNIDKRTEEFRNLNEMGNDLMLSSESTSVQELARKFTQLNAKWTERRFAEVQAKFERFKSPSNIEPRLNRAIRELHSIEEASCLLELASDDPEGIEGQLKHCLLGSQITDAKTQLDNALELSRSLHSNLPQLSHWLDELDAHLEECDKAESSQDLEAGITYLRDKLLKGETLHKEFTNILHEVKSSLQDAESKIKVLDAVPPNQLSEKHLAECKALQNDMILRKGQLDELRSSVQQIHSLDPSAEMQLADGDKQYNELWARIQNWSDKATILAKGHPETSRALDATKTQSLPSLPPPTPSRTPRGGSRGREEEQICNKTELTTSLSSKEASDQPQQTSNVSSSEQMEIDGVGYSNPAFDDSVLATTKLDSEGEEITCISRTVKRKVDIGVVPDLVPSVKTTESLWGQIQPQVKGEDDSTFRLAEDSVLFSQVSSNTLVPQTTKFEEHLREMPQSRIQSSLQDDSCRVVEIREMEIVKHAVYPRQSTDATIHYVSDTVEMVEIEDTETEPESATETDSEDKKSKTDDTKDSQSRKRDEVDDPSYDTVIPNKRLAKKSPTPQKKETDEEIIRVSPSTKVDVPIYPSTPASIENLLNETADTLTRAEPRKLILASPVAEKLVTPTPPPTPTACASDAPPPSLCLQMTDRVNKTEQMTVTAWRDAECTSNTCMPVAPRRRSLEEENRSKSSEKEIEVSKTYKIIGNISDLQTQSLPTEKMIEEYESFYGSDKETDDVVEFSDDVATSATMSSFPAKATPQAAPRSSSSILRGTVPPLLEREILEFEQAAQQMLRRMDLRKHQAQQAEEKLREFNYSVSALEPWLRDARRRLELANNDEGQLQQLQEEFEQKQKEFSELAEQSAELAALNVRHGEASVHDIQTRWQDVHDRFQHFKKEGLDKTKVVPDTKSTMDTNGTQTADFVTRVNKVREAVSTISRQLNSFPLSGRDYDGYQQQEEYLKRVKEGVAALKPSVDDIDRWLKCRDTWVSLHSNCQSFDDWLTNAESMITEWRSCDFPLAEAKIKQKELEKQVTMRTRTMSNMNMACREIISQGLCDHREYVECKLASLKRYTLSLDAIIAWNSVYDREMEVKEVLENYNNLEKECEGARQPVSVELQEKVKKLREDWHYVKSRGEVPITAQESIVTPSIKTVTSPPLRSSPLVTSNISSVKPVSSSPSVHAGERFVEG